MQLINGALLLSAKDLFFMSLLFSPPPSVTIVPLTTIYASLKSHRSEHWYFKSYLFTWFECIFSTT